MGRLLGQFPEGGGNTISGSLTDFLYNHFGPSSSAVALYTRTTQPANTWYYLLSGHQGSVSSVTSSAGANVVGESFAAYGWFRSASTWSGVGPAILNYTRRGFTFQNMLGTGSGLIHMNGRVEDAFTGRFLSPDPYIQDPENTQNYNRYSYVNNNPLSYVDPSGFCGVTDAGEVVVCASLENAGIETRIGAGGAGNQQGADPGTKNPPEVPCTDPSCTQTVRGAVPPPQGNDLAKSLQDCINSVWSSDGASGNGSGSTLGQTLTNLGEAQTWLDASTATLAGASATDLGRALGTPPRWLSAPTNFNYTTSGMWAQSGLRAAAPYITLTGYGLGGASILYQGYTGYTTGGVAGAAQATAYGVVDYGIEASLAAEFPFGTAAAIAYDRAGGSQAFVSMYSKSKQIATCEAAAGIPQVSL